MATKKKELEAVTETVEKTENASVDESNTSKVLVYVGPTLKSTLLWQHRSFLNGYPPEVETLKEKHPYITRLFVTPDKVVSAMQEIGKTGSAMNVYYKRMTEV